MDINVTKSEVQGYNNRPGDNELGFGKCMTDHMFLMEYDEGQGWHDARIVPYGPLDLDPAAMVLHYDQEVFEGLKAYAQPDGGIALFRPDKNLDRMNASLARLLMPTLHYDEFFLAIKELVLTDRNWLPTTEGTSLYIRPVVIATEPALGVHPASQYLFYVIVCAVGAYYPEGFSPTKIYATDDYVRAVAGGVGATKTGGNYSPTLLAAQQAAEKGYTQVLWLDAIERKYIEEVGTSNIFFLMGDELITPPLAGTILPGVTRDSVIHIAGHQGISVIERPITIDEVIDGINTGALKEVFASGTAAVISPVGIIGYHNHDHQIADGQIGRLSRSIYEEITGIQYGLKEDPFGWRVKIA